MGQAPKGGIAYDNGTIWEMRMRMRGCCSQVC